MARSTQEFGDPRGRPTGVVEAPPRRQSDPGSRQPGAAPRLASRMLIPSIVTLASWRLRKTWGLLLITGIGIIAAVMLVCTVPLFSDITMTAGLRGVLTSPSDNTSINVYSVSTRISAPVINKTTQSLNQDFQKNLGPYLTPSYFSLQPPVLTIFTNKPGNSRGTACCAPLRPTADQVELISAPMDTAPPHAILIAGRLPRANSSDLEIAITPESAANLQMTVGSVIPVSIDFIDANQALTERMLNLHIVGIFHVARTDDPFWSGNDFHYISPEGNQLGYTYPALISTQTGLSAFTKISDDAAAHGQFFPQSNSATLFWAYHLDISHIAIGDLDRILAGVQNVQLDTSNNSNLDNSPYVENSKAYLPTDILQRYHDRIAVAQLPVASLLLLVLGLVLFFISMMADLLVERQLSALAILRSRGGSRRQVFGAIMIQSIGLAIVALIVGPLLAIVMARFLAQHTLSPADQGALNIIAGNPLSIALSVGWFALGAAAITILAMFLAILRSMRLDILAMRREAARSSRQPLWQRLNLDVIAAIIMIVGFGFSLYLENENVLDPRLRLLLLSPLTLLESVFLLLAIMLLFLRFYPLLLRGGSWLAGRSRSASPALALAQMARAPRQSVRMILLLALASSFAIFTLVFTASQAQRITDVSAYEVGADFSGTIPYTIVLPQQLKKETAAYLGIPGVSSASLGYTTVAKSGGIALSIPIYLQAVDADTYASTAVWPTQDSPQELPSWMAELSARRASSIAQKVVPALVDAATWDALHLSPGKNFTVDLSPVDYATDYVHFIALAKVQDIPTPNTKTGILVDYLTYANVYANNHTNPKDFYVPANYVWLRTKSDPASLASVRNALNNVDLGLDPLYNRRALISSLKSEPLYLDLNGVLALGAATALLLAVVGDLIASWLSARSRLTNFAVLRALGASPPQIAGTLAWEQGIIYTTSLLMGAIFGILLSVLVLPGLIYTSIAPSGSTSDVSSGAFYVAQSAPAIQIVIPASLWIAFGVLVAICMLALGMMVRVVSRPSMSQTLRLNED